METNPTTMPGPRAGRSLGLLIGVAAVLWLWVQLPAWYQAGHAPDDAAGAWLRRAVYNEWTALALVLTSNLLVARYTTAPMWRLGHSLELRGIKGAFVLVLAGLFHLLIGGFGVLLAGLVLLDVSAPAPNSFPIF